MNCAINDRKVIDRGWLLLYAYYSFLCVYELISRTHTKGAFIKTINIQFSAPANIMMHRNREKSL